MDTNTGINWSLLVGCEISLCYSGRRDQGRKKFSVDPSWCTGFVSQVDHYQKRGNVHITINVQSIGYGKFEQTEVVCFSSSLGREINGRIEVSESKDNPLISILLEPVEERVELAADYPDLEPEVVIETNGVVEPENTPLSYRGDVLPSSLKRLVIVSRGEVDESTGVLTPQGLWMVQHQLPDALQEYVDVDRTIVTSSNSVKMVETKILLARKLGVEWEMGLYLGEDTGSGYEFGRLIENLFRLSETAGTIIMIADQAYCQEIAMRWKQFIFMFDHLAEQVFPPGSCLDLDLKERSARYC